ncbi:hypothetical protein COLO4_36606 [Corchorus olitorius]|uniref:Uncharacterized protein n=1 Tax=Corchorus olitorius TaxID=93759 RepID=A0A1R3G7C5_9ROSI|nr:hypothetical protein COLO4_36606 [Corchorus olitorius]
MDNEVLESSCMALATCAIQRWSCEPILSGQSSKIGLKSALFPRKRSFDFLKWNSFSTRRHGWKIAFALDTGGISGNGGEDSVNSDSPNIGGTRLGRIVSAGGRQLLEKLNSARKNFPMKGRYMVG